MNICSSRSHALLNVTVVGHNCINGIKTTGNNSLYIPLVQYVLMTNALIEYVSMCKLIFF